jgi:hypothetical protein
MKTTPENANTDASAEEIAVNENVIVLETPIKRGLQEITSLTLRKPSAGELRGVQLSELLGLDVASLIKVLPRLCTPSISAPEVANMDPADLVACGSKIMNFLLPKSMKTDASLVA